MESVAGMLNGTAGSFIILIVVILNIAMVTYIGWKNSHIVLSRYDLAILAMAFFGLLIFEALVLASEWAGLPMSGLILVSRATRLLLAVSLLFVMHRALARQVKILNTCSLENGEHDVG